METTTLAPVPKAWQQIQAQIGQGAFYMMGAQNLAHDVDRLSWKIRGSRAWSHVSVKLTAGDVYAVTFYKWVGCNMTNMKKVEGVYVAQLARTIEENTGLRLSL